MTKKKQIDGVAIFAVILMLIWLAFSGLPAYASGDDINIATDSGSYANNTGVSNSSNYDARSLAFANHLGDVDINNCRESHQWATPIYSRQTIKLNPWCAAEVYDAKGLPELAAMTRCTIKEIRRLFPDDDSCVVANTIQFFMEAPAPVEVSVDEDEEQHEEQIMAQQAVIDTQQHALEMVTDRLDRLETAKRAPRPVTNQVGLTDKQRAALAEVFEQ